MCKIFSISELENENKFGNDKKKQCKPTEENQER